MYNDELYYSILNTSGVISNSAFKRIYSDNGLYNRSNIVHLGNDIIFQNIDDNKITTYGINVSSGVSVITKKGESSSYNSTYAHLEALEESPSIDPCMYTVCSVGETCNNITGICEKDKNDTISKNIFFMFIIFILIFSIYIIYKILKKKNLI